MENTTTGAASDTAAAPEIAEHILAALKPDSVITMADATADLGGDCPSYVTAVLVDGTPVADFVGENGEQPDDARAQELVDALRAEVARRLTADRIAALIEAVRAFQAPGMQSTTQYVGVHADVSVHYLNDEDIVAALGTLGVVYEMRDGLLAGEQFRTYVVEVGEGAIQFFGQTARERQTFGDYLAENAASFTEVQS